jgi:hypothetical protein
MSEIKFGSKDNYFYGDLLYDEPKVIWCKTLSILKLSQYDFNIYDERCIDEF